MRVRVSRQARADVIAAAEWWRRNLPDAEFPLRDDLLRARQVLQATPHAGIAVADEALPTLRRLALLRSRYFLFYEVDESQQAVNVLRIWHMSRGGPPALTRGGRPR